MTATLLNRDVFAEDVTRNQLRNQGVAKVGRPRTDAEWSNLAFELSSFVCDGAYADGLERILASFLSNVGRDQPAVWVSGFYGSGKSHFARVLEYLWRDESFPDGQKARDKVRLPQRIREQLVDLSTEGRRAGGLWSASGLLSAQASKDAGSDAIRLATLGIVFGAAGLPTQISRARFILWLHRHGRYETVRRMLGEHGATLEEEVANLHVAEVLPEVLAELVPVYEGSSARAMAAIQAEFPRNVTDISNDDFIEVLDQVLGLMGQNGKRPLTLIVFDELQQFLNDDAARTLQVQEIVEAVTSRFRGDVLFLATGQAAMNENPNLQKLQGRFSVRVMLQDTDVEHVVREVILRKDQTKVPQLTNVLDRASGEINRQLNGTRIAPGHADRDYLVPDYPLLPARRRFWERLLRSIDTGGRAGQLRTQLHIVQQTNAAVASQPVGTVIGADAIYGAISADMQATGLLPAETNALFAQLERDPKDGPFKARVARLVFLIQQLVTEGPLAAGLTATEEHLGDLLVEDLTDPDTTIRRPLGPVLADLVDTGALQLIDGHYQIQTVEGREWDIHYSGRAAALRNDDPRLREERDTRIRAEVTRLLGKLRVRQGESKTERETQLFVGATPPSAYGAKIPVWVRDEWSTPRTTVISDARKLGQDSEVVLVSIPQQSAAELREATVKALAAQETIYARQGVQSTTEGVQAQAAMESRLRINEDTISRIIAEVVGNAVVFQGGGAEVRRGSLTASVEQAVEAGVSRLFTRFAPADHLGWEKVYERAVGGVPDPLKAVGWDGEPERQPVIAEVLKFLGGAGKSGNEVRKHFEDAPYGWPKRAAEAALVVLVATGRAEAKLNGATQPSKSLTSQKLGTVRFTAEDEPLTNVEVISLVGLVQSLDPTAKQVTREQLPVYLRQLLSAAKQDAAAAGGEAPAPVPQSAKIIVELGQRTGNNQLKEIYKVRAELKSAVESWRAARKEIERRLPAWKQLNDLLAHAEGMPSLDSVLAQAEAIRDNRALLDNPDPVTPLRTQVADALRAALQRAHAETQAALVRETETLRGTPEWDRLTDARWAQIFRDHGLQPVVEPKMATDADLLRTLDHAPLDSWETRRQSYPTRVKQAFMAAAELLERERLEQERIEAERRARELAVAEAAAAADTVAGTASASPVQPKTVMPKVQPKPMVTYKAPTRMIDSETDLDAWLDTQRERIAKLLAEGKRVAV